MRTGAPSPARSIRNPGTCPAPRSPRYVPVPATTPTRYLLSPSVNPSTCPPRPHRPPSVPGPSVSLLVGARSLPPRHPRQPRVPVTPAQPVPCPRRFLTSKEQFHAFLRAGGEPSGRGGGEDGEEVEEKKEDEDEDVGSPQSEPPAKRVRPEEPGQDGESREEDGAAEKEPAERKRARGQNKSRPCMKPTRYEQNRLCPSVTQVGHGALGRDGCSEQFWARADQAYLTCAGG